MSQALFLDALLAFLPLNDDAIKKCESLSHEASNRSSLMLQRTESAAERANSIRSSAERNGELVISADRFSRALREEQTRISDEILKPLEHHVQTQCSEISKRLASIRARISNAEVESARTVEIVQKSNAVSHQIDMAAEHSVPSFNEKITDFKSWMDDTIPQQ